MVKGDNGPKFGFVDKFHAPFDGLGFVLVTFEFIEFVALKTFDFLMTASSKLIDFNDVRLCR